MAVDGRWPGVRATGLEGPHKNVTFPQVWWEPAEGLRRGVKRPCFQRVHVW